MRQLNPIQINRILRNLRKKINQINKSNFSYQIEVNKFEDLVKKILKDYFHDDENVYSISNEIESSFLAKPLRQILKYLDQLFLTYPKDEIHNLILDYKIINIAKKINYDELFYTVYNHHNYKSFIFTNTIRYNHFDYFIYIFNLYAEKSITEYRHGIALGIFHIDNHNYKYLTKFLEVTSICAFKKGGNQDSILSLYINRASFNLCSNRLILSQTDPELLAGSSYQKIIDLNFNYKLIDLLKTQHSKLLNLIPCESLDKVELLARSVMPLKLVCKDFLKSFVGIPDEIIIKIVLYFSDFDRLTIDDKYFTLMMKMLSPPVEEFQHKYSVTSLLVNSAQTLSNLFIKTPLDLISHYVSSLLDIIQPKLKPEILIKEKTLESFLYSKICFREKLLVELINLPSQDKTQPIQNQLV